MFCRKCGKEMPDGSTFCPSCGEKNGSSEGVTRIKLTCSTCNGTMEVDPSSQTLFCPYCGSKEIIKSSDSVEIEKIKTEAYKEVEYAKIKNQNEKEARAEAKAEAKEARDAYKKSKFSKVTIVFAVIFLLVAFAEFSAHPLGGIIAIIQGGLLLASWLMGMQIIPEKKKNLHMLLAVIGFILTILLFVCLSDEDDSKNDKQTDEITSTAGASTITQAELDELRELELSLGKTEETSVDADSEEQVEESKPEIESEQETVSEISEEKPAEDTNDELPLSNVVDPDLKEFLDSYEAFMDEYIAFMEKYKDSDNAMLMLTDYLKMVEKANEFSEAAEKYDPDTMNAVDSAYYLEVMGRIELKLLKVAALG